MPTTPPHAAADRRRVGRAGPLLIVLTAGLAACGGGGGDDSLTPQEANGRELTIQYTCQACHGAELRGGMSSALAGLPGKTVTLVDGTTVVADDAYLARSIADPAAQLSAGGEGTMPDNDLTDDQIADIIAYLKTLPEPDG